MAAAVTITEVTFNPVKKIKFEWTSAADGTATGTTTKAFSGQVLRLVTVPGSDAAQPADQYDVTITDHDNIDVLNGQGANRSNVNTEQVVASLGCVASDMLTLNVSGAGDSKQGTACLYLR